MFTSISKAEKSTGSLVKISTHFESSQNRDRENAESGDEVEITYAKVI